MSCPLGFVRNFFRPAASTISSVNGLRFDLLQCLALRGFFSFHLVEHPKTPVCLTATSRFASSASMAFCASCVFTISDAIAVVDVALVAKPAALVEDKDVRRRLGTVCRGDSLRVAGIEVRIVRCLYCSADLHLVEGVAHVGGIEFIDPDCLRIVPLDCDDGHAAISCSPSHNCSMRRSYICAMGQWLQVNTTTRTGLDE